MALIIVRNDITKTEADAIVNSANPEPVCGRGVDYAIYKAAGAKDLLAARKKIGPIAPWQAASTCWPPMRKQSVSVIVSLALETP